MVITSILLIAIGVVFAALGLRIWRKEDLSLIHDYHTDHLSAEDRTAFCRRIGIGMLCMSLGAGISGVLCLFTESAGCFVPMYLGFGAGIVLLIGAVRKYNR